MTIEASTILLTVALSRLRQYWWDSAHRDAALIEIARRLGELGAAPLPAHLEGNECSDARLLTIARYAPSVLAGLAVPLEGAPYVMTVGARDFVSRTINTGPEGFRHTRCDGRVLTRGDFADAAGARVLLVGNSTAWGVGVSDDSAHLASVINGEHAGLCLNASVKGSNLMQQALMAQQHLPENGTIVVLSGVLDLILALSWPRDRQHGALPFWDVGDADLTREAGWALDPGAYEHDDACLVMRHALLVLAETTRRQNGRCLFVLQPHLDFASKAVTRTEDAVARAFAIDIGAFRPIHARGVLREHAATFPQWIARECDHVGLAFLDMNSDAGFRGDDEMFVDHIHVTDAGHRRMAQRIAEWLRNPEHAAGSAGVGTVGPARNRHRSREPLTDNALCTA